MSSASATTPPTGVDGLKEAVTPTVTAVPPIPSTGTDISIPPSSLAENEMIVAHLIDLINRACEQGEAGFWNSQFKRAYPHIIKEYLTKGNLALAWSPDSTPSSPNPADLPLGCVTMDIVDSGTAVNIGMLCTDLSHRGAGVGSQLLQFAEDWAREGGLQTATLSLLQPDGWDHPFKERLRAWYERKGYVLEKISDPNVDYPFLMTWFVRPAKTRIYRKVL